MGHPHDSNTLNVCCRISIARPTTQTGPENVWASSSTAHCVKVSITVLAMSAAKAGHSVGQGPYPGSRADESTIWAVHWERWGGHRCWGVSRASHTTYPGVAGIVPWPILFTPALEPTEARVLWSFFAGVSYDSPLRAWHFYCVHNVI